MTCAGTVRQVETVTKTVDLAEGVTVSLDYKEWRKEFSEHGTCTYKGAAQFTSLARTLAALLPVAS